MQPPFDTLRWIGGPDGYLELLDQTKLPGVSTYLQCRDLETVWDAIKRLVVRGAPAIGITAAYGAVIGMQGASDESHFWKRLAHTRDYLATSPPTAVILFWALQRMRECSGSAQLSWLKSSPACSRKPGAFTPRTLGCARPSVDAAWS